MTEQLRVVCTDRLRHPSRELAVIQGIYPPDHEMLDRFLADPFVSENKAFRMAGYTGWQADRIAVRPAARGGRIEARSVIKSGDPYRPTWRFLCPTCTRDWQCSTKNLSLMFDTLTGAGRRSVDISALPASMV